MGTWGFDDGFALFLGVRLEGPAVKLLGLNSLSAVVRENKKKIKKIE